MNYLRRRTEKMNPFRVKVIRSGFKNSYFSDIFHFVLAISWFEFFIINTSLYICMNLFFASLYFMGGESILNADPHSFWDAFVFSFQTSTTIGYGHLQPANHYADAIVIFDTLSGIIFVAITTGLAFAKFSRPTARVIFTKNCVIHNYEGKKTLMFRVANKRDSHIADASIDAVAVMKTTSAEGVQMQRLYDLKLVRQKTPMFFLSWTVMHIINKESPLYGLTEKDFEQKNLRLVVSLSGIDDWSSQMVHTNHIYQNQEIIEQKKFADILTTNNDNSITMNLKNFNKLIEL